MNAAIDKGSYDIMIMQSILKEDKEILNTYVPTTEFYNTIYKVKVTELKEK